ncbi:MAG: glycosyltransferase family 2 protein [Endomicrobium sp.]|jgi:glycosyltransferase involved in cell wall biosynthesis|nr:glycosyltransferase family 2 protein [Endomicrobium sp.]
MLVSIALATYNGERFLKKQLDSLLAQTYKNIEIIVCDDYSSDGTLSLLKSYPQIKILQNKKNLGFVKTFEKVLYQAKGDYIALCDQDDIWLPDKIEFLIKEFGNNVLLHSDAYIIDDNDNIIYDTISAKIKKSLTNKTFTDYIRKFSITGCCAIFKKELLQTALPFPQNTLFHDWWLAICAAKSGKIKYIEKPLIKYRIHNNNATFNYYNRAIFYKKSIRFYCEIEKKFSTNLSFYEIVSLKLCSRYMLVKYIVFSIYLFFTQAIRK